MRLVSKKIPAAAINTMPSVPVTMSPKYNPTITKASTARTALSTVPMFFFILFSCLKCERVRNERDKGGNTKNQCCDFGHITT